jgi:hypothetical protein
MITEALLKNAITSGGTVLRGKSKFLDVTFTQAKLGLVQ